MLVQLGVPYWQDPEEGKKARWALAGVIALTLGQTGVSVLFNFLGRDFFNALSQKDAERFTQMLFKWLGGIALGVPVFVYRDYLQSRLSLEWRDYMTRKLTEDYFRNTTFYQIQSGAMIDNPDQRVDLISFSGILYSIYPPLFLALLVYSIGGTGTSLFLGRKLVGLNFQQEAQEANFRFGLVRVRENAESIAFYNGEASEAKLLFQRLSAVVVNYGQLLVTSRNLSFFTSFYRFLIQVLPAAVVAPLYFRGEIEFGVINQSSSAFNHILTDVSLVVYQIEALAGFSAIIDRLGEFSEVVETFASPDQGSADASGNGSSAPQRIELIDVPTATQHSPAGQPLLRLEGVTLRIPDGSRTLVDSLDVEVAPGESLLVVGPSGAGKTSLLRAIAGLWSSGSGKITRHALASHQRYGKAVSADGSGGDILFVPQRPYMVLGTLREQLLYPTWPTGANSKDVAHARRPPGDDELREVLAQVRLSPLLQRSSQAPSNGNSAAAAGLDCQADWAAMLSLGEQQRLAFGRILLSKPKLVLMDEATSALDIDNEEHLYKSIAEAGVTFVSIGHRPSLASFHQKVLRINVSGSQDANDSPKPVWELANAA
ncbi:g7149 [Coccomyxa viridis]|uniref:G7149 protein n=1 Tax=Coccomyxa viridis TaxID=1274662 RepID=A0ABP1G1Z2_9CHLO